MSVAVIPCPVKAPSWHQLPFPWDVRARRDRDLKLSTVPVGDTRVTPSSGDKGFGPETPLGAETVARPELASEASCFLLLLLFSLLNFLLGP